MPLPRTLYVLSTVVAPDLDIAELHQHSAARDISLIVKNQIPTQPRAIAAHHRILGSSQLEPVMCELSPYLPQSVRKGVLLS